MKKILSLFLCVITVVTTICMTPFSAFASSYNETTVENPIYSGKEIPTGSLDSTTFSTQAPTTTYKGKKYYSDSTTLYKQMRDLMVKRTSKITINLYSKQNFNALFSKSFNTFLNNLTMGAGSDEISVSNVDGDYLYYQYAGANATYQCVDKDSSYYYYTVNLTMKYNDTYAQEQEITNIVNNIKSTITTNGKSDVDIIRAIHNYVCNTTAYDNDYNKRNDNYDYSIYGALVKHKCVCQGYSLAFYRICREFGYKTRIVCSDPNVGCHAWNMVELNNKYYFVDCTWDDAKSIIYDYFLKNYNDIQKDDSKYKFHELYDNFYSNEYFIENYQNNFAKYSFYYKSKSIENCQIQLDKTQYCYTGQSVYPKVSVEFRGYPLTYNKEYTIKYYNNVNVGTGKIVVTGYGDYAGTSSTREFKINAQSISSGVFKLNTTSYIYSGKENKPIVTVYGISKNDCYVTYSNNINCGIATATIKGKNNYGGSVSKNFYIYPKIITSFDCKSGTRTYSTLQLQWSKHPSVTGYEMQQYKNGKWVYFKNFSSTTSSYYLKNLNASTVYKFRIRAYKKVNSTTLYGGYKYYTTCTTPKKTTITTIKTKSKSIYIKYNKAYCSGYQIQYSTNSNMSNSKYIYDKSRNGYATIRSLKKGKKYYIRVRPYKTNIASSGKTIYYYGKYSGIKYILCK